MINKSLPPSICKPLILTLNTFSAKYLKATNVEKTSNFNHNGQNQYSEKNHPKTPQHLNSKAKRNGEVKTS